MTDGVATHVFPSRFRGRNRASDTREIFCFDASSSWYHLARTQGPTEREKIIIYVRVSFFSASTSQVDSNSKAETNFADFSIAGKDACHRATYCSPSFLLTI